MSEIYNEDMLAEINRYALTGEKLTLAQLEHLGAILASNPDTWRRFKEWVEIMLNP